MCARRRPCGPDYFDSPGPHPRLTRPSVLVYNTGEDFPRPHRLTTPRSTHVSVPSLKPRSSLSSVSRGLVYINTLGRTCLHGMFIEYKASHNWGSPVVFQIGGKLSSTAVCTGWINGQARKSPPLQFWLNFKSPVGRNHWPSC